MATQDDVQLQQLLRLELEYAQQRFTPFVDVATDEDLATLAALLLVRKTLLEYLRLSHEGISDIVRGDLERVIRQSLATFSAYCDELRTCTTFRMVPPSERERIETEVFSLPDDHACRGVRTR